MFKNRLRKAVLPLSLKEPEHKIMGMAKILAHFGTKKISLVHIKSRTNRRSFSVQERLQTYAQKIQEMGYETEIKVNYGQNILHEISKISTEVKAEFLCIIWKAKGIFKRTLIGSKTIEAIRHTNLPIFIYKHRIALINKNSSIDSILYATDFKITDSIVIPYLNNKDITASKLILLHVGDRAPDPDTENQRLNSVYANLERLNLECLNCFKEVETIQVIGTPKRKIVRQARKNNTDLILIGKFDALNTLEQIMGSTAEAIAFKSSCSVFILPGLKHT